MPAFDGSTSAQYKGTRKSAGMLEKLIGMMASFAFDWSIDDLLVHGRRSRRARGRLDLFDDLDVAVVQASHGEAIHRPFTRAFGPEAHAVGMSKPRAQVLTRGLDAHARDSVGLGDLGKLRFGNRSPSTARNLLLDLHDGINHDVLLWIRGKRRRHVVGRELVDDLDLLRSRLPDRVAGRERSREGDALKLVKVGRREPRAYLISQRDSLLAERNLVLIAAPDGI